MSKLGLAFGGGKAIGLSLLTLVVIAIFIFALGRFSHQVY